MEQTVNMRICDQCGKPIDYRPFPGDEVRKDKQVKLIVIADIPALRKTVPDIHSYGDLCIDCFNKTVMPEYERLLECENVTVTIKNAPKEVAASLKATAGAI